MGVVFPTGDTGFIIGRDPESNLCLSRDRAVSWRHCRILINQNGLTVEDLGSRNGTYVNGGLICEPTLVDLPASLQVGRTYMGLVRSEDEQERNLLEDTMFATKGRTIMIPPVGLFVERCEALLVVDIIDSTSILRQGDKPLVKIVSTLGHLLEKLVREEEQPFLKCTGDGFFACFGSADRALEAALALAPDLTNRLDKHVSLSMALHYGTASMTAGRDRTGRNVHAVFSLEDLRHREEKIKAWLVPDQPWPLILMTEAFRRELLPEKQEKTIRLGRFELKGLTKPEKIHICKMD